MSDGNLERRFDRFDERQTEILVQLGTMEGKLDKVNGSVADLLAEVGNVPDADARGDRKTITTRLHSLESTVSPSAIEAAMTRVLAKRRVAIWKAWQLRLTLLSVVVGMIFTVLRFAGYGG
jgi:hypothetical protein